MKTLQRKKQQTPIVFDQSKDTSLLYLLLQGQIPPSFFSEQRFLHLLPIVEAVSYLQGIGETAPYNPKRIWNIAHTKFNGSDTLKEKLKDIVTIDPDKPVLEVIRQRLLYEKTLDAVSQQLDSGKYNPESIIDLLEGYKDTRQTIRAVRLRKPRPERVQYLTQSHIRKLDRVIGGFGAELILVGAPPKQGKALAADELVLTTTGWKKHKDIHTGDFVIGSDGKPTQVCMVKHWKKRTCYRVEFVDGASIIADENHDWEVWSRRSSEITIQDTKTLHHTNRKWKTTLPQAIHMPQKQYSVHPYIVGLWLGDGSYQGGYIHTNSKKVRKRLSLLKEEWHDIVEGKSLYQYGLKEKLHTLIPKHCTSVTKYIPEEYLQGSVTQRRWLLRGLFDTDTYFGKDGTIEYTSCSIVLVHQIKQLVHSLGGTAYVSRNRIPRYQSGDGQRSYSLRIQLPTLRKKKGLGRKIVRIEKLTEKYDTVCLTVSNSDGLYVVRDYVLTHNSNFFINLAARQPPHVKTLYVTIADYSADDISTLVNVVHPGLFNEEHNFYIADYNGLHATILDIEQEIKAIWEPDVPMLVIVDRAEKMKPMTKGLTDLQVYEEIFYGLRRLAKRYTISMFADAQYGRAGQDYTNNEGKITSSFLYGDHTIRQSVMDMFIGILREENETTLFLEGRRQGRLPTAVTVETSELGVYKS